MPWNVAFVINLLVTGGSIYTLAALLTSIDEQRLAAIVGAVVPHRPVGGVLLGLGLLFLLLVLVKLDGALLGTAPLRAVDLAVSSADVLTIPAWLFGGWLLWRRRPFGYLVGPGLLSRIGRYSY